MTRQLISTVRQPPLHYLTRSVRRTSGFVLADKKSAIGCGEFNYTDTLCQELSHFTQKTFGKDSLCELAKHM